MKVNGWNVFITPECGVMVTFGFRDGLQIVTQDADTPKGLVIGAQVMCTVQVTFRPDYPRTPAGIVLIQPFSYVFPSAHVDAQLGYTLMDDLVGLTTSLFDRRAEMAGRLPCITGSAFLVLGASPHEARRNRMHYDNPSVFFLDLEAGIRHSQLIPADFSSPVEMGILSSLLPNAFDEICFDQSTFKFFNGDSYYDEFNLMKHEANPKIRSDLPGAMLYERVCCLARMLKDTGTMFLEEVSGVPGGAWDPQSHEWRNRAHYSEQYRAKVVEICERAGLVVDFKKVREIRRSSMLVHSLYTTVADWPRSAGEDVSLRDGMEIELLVARKQPTQHGGRRASRTQLRQLRSPSHRRSGTGDM
jgi:hypothetical protein